MERSQEKSTASEKALFQIQFLLRKFPFPPSHEGLAPVQSLSVDTIPSLIPQFNFHGYGILIC